MKNCWPILLLLLLFTSCGNDHNEQACFHVIRDDYTEKISVNGTIQAVDKIYLKAPTMFLSRITWVEDDGTHVQQGDTVCLLEHPEMSSQLEGYKDELDKLTSQLEKLEANHQVKIAMLQAEIENNNIQLSINNLDSVQKKFAPPIQQKLISLEQQKAEILKQKLEKKFTAQKTIGETEIRGLGSRIKQMENRIQRTQKQLEELIIKAPKDGILIREEAPSVMLMSSSGSMTLGGKIQEGTSTMPNMNILQIPNLEKMQVMAELTENDYKKAKDGQKVLIRVEAKNNLLTSGVIKRKMLTGRQQNRNSKVKMYEALVEIDSCHKQLTPGMNAACEIIINEFKDTIVVPAIAVFDENEEKYVYVKEGKKFRKTIIESAYINGSFCVIKSGLTVDCYIAMSRPLKGKVIKEKERMPETESEPADSIEKEITASDTIQFTNR